MKEQVFSVSLHILAAGLKSSEAADRPAVEQNIEEEQSAPAGEASPGQENNPGLSEAADVTASTFPNGRTLTQRRDSATNSS